jgi:nitrous oxide reductase accessory protein NosL
MTGYNWRIADGGAYIVRVTFNDTEGSPGVVLCGPFADEADAEDFAQNWGDGDTEIEDAEVLYLNTVARA